MAEILAWWKQRIQSAGGSRIHALAKLLVEPWKPDLSEEDRLGARLVALLLIVVAPIGLVLAALPQIIEQRQSPLLDPDFRVVSASLLFWGIAYWLARSGRTQSAALTTIVAASLVVFGAVIYDQDKEDAVYLLMILLYASFVLSLRSTVLIACTFVIALFGVAYLLPDVSLLDMVTEPISFVGIGAVLIVALAWHRSALESHRLHQISASEARYRTLFASAFDGVAVITDGVISEANEGLAVLLGRHSPKELEGVPVAQLFDQETHLELMKRLDSQNDSPFEGQCWRIDGSTAPVEIIVRAQDEPEVPPETVRCFVAVRDITERRDAEEALLRYAQELERSNRDLHQFAYVASHDLQEPLRTVGGFVQLLRRRYAGKLDAEADEYIAFAVEGVQRMTTLLNDILAYASLGGGELTRRTVALDRVIAAVETDLRGVIRQNDARIVYNELPTVQGDFTRLVQLFQNLINNAIRFRSHEPPRIRISASRRGPYWQIGVHDNGIGIEQKYWNRVFLVFQSLQSKSVHNSTGIGLAICKRIVEQHGGQIWVESTPGQGATFWFTLPVPPAATDGDALPTQPPG